MADIKEVAGLFEIEGNITEIERYGGGHINDTYRFTATAGGRKVYYILQRINHRVFKNVDGLMKNIDAVTTYIKEKSIEETGRAKGLLEIIPTKKGDIYVNVDGEYYRCYNCIENAYSIETTPTIEEFFMSGVGYGKFQKCLDGFPADKLVETIPNFHNTEARYKKFADTVSSDPKGRFANVQKEVDFFLSRKAYAGKVVNLIASGDIPLRVTHNDTKLNNILIDFQTKETVAVIDLDTVMPGSMLYDFGDSIRSGANTGAEDEKDLEKVHFSLPHFDAYAKGFIGEVKDIITLTEAENMAFGAILMTYECGMRFLTDYLEGDVYFKIHRDGHNLDRARTQIKMVEEMEKALADMNAAVKKYAAK